MQRHRHFFLLFILIFSFQLSKSTNFYWVGGKGNWNDPSHWSNTSGGNGGLGVPNGLNDHVFFDQHSFSHYSESVYINSNLIAGNFTVTSTPNFKLYSSAGISFTITGNFDVTSRFRNLINGTIYFSGSGSQTIKSNSVFHSDIFFNHAGSYTLLTDFITDGQLKFIHGNFSSNSKSIKARTISVNDNNVFVDLSNSIVLSDIFNPPATHPEDYLLTNSETILMPDPENQNYRGTNSCGSPVMTITTYLDTTYNGYGVTCNGATDGIVCITVSGGVGPFWINWLDPLAPDGYYGTGTECFNGVGNGTYGVLVTDEGQGSPPFFVTCGTSHNVVEPSEISLITLQLTDPTCFGDCDGSASPIIFDDLPITSYIWNGGTEVGPTATSLCTGINTLTTFDANGCQFDTTFFILTPTVVVPNVVTTNASCFGVCDGTAVSEPTGGNGSPYTFSWSTGDTGPGPVEDSITGLCNATYSVNVLDNEGCPGNQTFTITEPLQIIVSVASQTDLVCNSICSGAITTNTTNGTSPYTYQWYDATTNLPIVGETNEDISGLCAGTYYVQVTDDNGCQDVSANIVISEPPPIVITPSATDILCFGDCTGTLSATVSGGTPNYDFQWYLIDFSGATPQPGLISANEINICAGNYFLEVIDDNSCLINSSVVIVNEPPELILSVTDVDVLCNTSCNGTANASAVGGIGSYDFEWFVLPNTSIGTGNSIANLCAGNYYCMVTDDNGCTDTIQFAITEPQSLSVLTESSTDVLCNGNCNGTVTFDVTGGTPTYTITWYDAATDLAIGQTGTTATNLCPGDYYAIAVDANNCSLQSSDLTVSEPAALSVTISHTDITCFGFCDGTGDLIISGGTLSYTIDWQNSTHTSIGQTTDPATGLCEGTYHAHITDANGCTATSGNITIDEPDDITASVTTTDLSCNGSCDGTAVVTASGGNFPYDFVWTSSPNTTDTEINLCAGNYSVTITDTNNCPGPTLNFTINENSQFNFTLTVSDPSCSGVCDGSATVSNITGEGGSYTLDWSSSANTTPTENNLCVANYTLTITDQNGCDTIHDFSIINPTPLVLTPDFTDPTCLGACNGTASANPIGATPPYTYVWENLDNSTILGTTTDTIQNLCDGNYQVTVTDDNGCSDVAQFTLTDPPGMTATTVAVPASCGIVCDGQATVTIVGGNSPYLIEWFDATTGNTTGITTNPATGLCAGNYYAVITDSTLCSIFSDTAVVTQVIVVTGTLVVNDPSCFGVCDGSIDLTPAGGNPPYTFEWFNQTTGSQIGQTTEDATGLCEGDYYVIITEGAGCNSAPLLATLTEPTEVTITLSGTDVSCFGVCDGSITAVVTGGTSPYTFEWFDASTGMTTGITTQNATNLCAGNYELVVTDDNGCTYTSSVETIIEPQILTGSLSVTDANCFGICDGSAVYTVSGGTIPYTFNWSSSSNTTDTENGLCDGNYTVSVSDASGCAIAPVNFTIDEPTQITAVVTDGFVLCNGDCNASASVVVSGGTSPYTYLWDSGANNQTTPVASNLCAGTFDVTVTDANGCTSVNLSATVTEPTALTLQNTSSTDATCGGVCDGTATISVTGGTPGYFYQWNDPLAQTTQTAVTLCAGTYDVDVTDANGCPLGTQSITVDEPNSLSVSVSPVDESCFNACDGSITAVITGGTGIPTVQWDDPTLQTTTTASALCAGNYTVDVTDANGCTATASGTINSAVSITATITSTDAQCGVCDGTATVTASGGTGTLDILWDNNAANQITATATSLCAGTYQVTVTDDNGCTNTFSAAVSNPNGETLTISATDASCVGVCDGTTTVTFNCGTPACSIQWNDPVQQTTNTATGLCAGSYGVQVTNGAGCISAAVIDVEEPSTIQPNATSTDVICEGDCNGTASTNPSGGDGNYTWLWTGGQTNPAAVNLCAGTYTVVVTDGNGCTGTAGVIVNEPNNPLSVSSVSSDVNCFGACDGTGTAFPSGGNPPYSYIWDDPAAQTTQMATGLCAGTYHVTVVDASGCTTGPSTVTINEPTEISASVSSTDIDCFGNCNGSGTLSVSGGTTPYTFQWDDPLSQTTSTATNLCTGTYNVFATDLNGCSTGTFTITLAEPTQLSLSVTGTDPLCNGNCNGSADAVISGGTTPYNIIWDDPSAQTTSTASNLCGGTFTIEITDANGCFEDASVTLVAPSILNVNSSFTDVTCFDLCDGTATVNPSGGSVPYSFLWSEGSTTNTISSLCPGTYDVDITDANGCNTSQSITIDEPSEITATFNFANSTCGNCTGSALVTPSGGVPGYTYQWDVAAGSGTTQNVANLCAGVYSVDVTDATGCTETIGVSISDGNGETVTITPTDASCFGLCDGSAIAVTACVDGPCAFEWFDGTGATTGVIIDNISNLCADNYFVEVTNASGCITIENTTINESPEIEGNGVITDASCGDVCDGLVALSPTGGNGTFTYLWNDPSSQTTQTANGLCGGNVDVQITSGGCTITETYFISQPDTLNVSETFTEPVCNGDCDGFITLTISDGVSPYSVVWSDTQTTTTAINLCAGNYSATITDANGCIETINTTLTEPSVLSATVSSNDVDCFGNCNGDATVSPSGGTTPYSIQWDDAMLQTTATATGLCAGTYNVTVTDSAFCTTTPLTVTINENPDITITATSTDVTCNSFCDGSITIVAGGGDGNYQYSIDNGATFQVSNSFANVCGGSYTVVVSDGNNCQNSVNVNVNEPAALGGTVDDFNATCGVDNGSANAIPTGGTPTYTFDWLDASLVPIGQSTQAATNLGAGIYNVLITDANGCTAILTAFISNFNAPTASVLSTVPPVCNGDCNGSIDMQITDGTPNYSFLWFAGGQTTEDLSNICAGTYTLEVTDAAGCIVFANATLNENPVIDATFLVTDATCGGCDGTAAITPTGGDGTYSVLWTNGDSGLNATSLCAGVYGAQVTDGAGCAEMINFAVSNPTGPTGENIITSDVSCFGSCDGTADVTPIGGTAPYTFFWVHDGSTTNTVSGLCAGTYFCEITDANDCVRTAEITINDAAQILDSTVITPADCGVCNGGLQIFATGGNGPFSFQWDAAAGNSTNQTVSNLCEGIYSVTITDGNGCTEGFTYSVNGKNAPQISVNSTDANCNGTCDGTATVNISGGIGPFTETWMDDAGTNLGLSGLTVNTLCEGDYIIQIVDQATSCLTTTSFSIDQPDSLQFSLPFLQDNTCFQSCDGILTAIVIEGTLPYTFVWDDPATSSAANIDSLCAGTYTVTVTDANGCSDTQSSTIIEPTEITMSFAITDASCSSVADGAIDVTASGGSGGYTYSWTGPNNFTSPSEDLTNILTGNYILTVTDLNGCSQTDTAFVNATVIVIADAGNDTTICGNLNTYTVNANGGITYEWYDTTGTLLASTQSYTFSPAPGTTTLILVAYDGLCTDSDTINININTPPTADAGPDVFTLAGIPIPIGGNPTGSPGTSFIWNPGSDLNDSTIANPSATLDTTTSFIVTVTDLNGCIATDTMIVEVLPPIFIPNGFSPNGDGPNDVWEIDYIEYFPDCQVEVYNRWGQLLFISVGYEIPWDGKYEDKEVPIGTYYYVINLNHPLYPDVFTGPLTILR